MKPTEVRLVAEIITAEHDSAEAAAKAAIAALDARRRDTDKNWCILRPAQFKVPLVYGPYPTQTQARKAVDKAVAISPGEQVVLVRLFTHIEED